jgi:mRNA interferase MazF
MQKYSNDYPKRGEIFIADLNPGFGRELHKKRPVLILSSNKVNEGTINTIIVPSSTQIPTATGPDTVLIDKSQGVDKPSVLLPIFMRSIDQKRLIKKIGTLSKSKMREVEESISLVLDLEKEL